MRAFLRASCLLVPLSGCAFPMADGDTSYAYEPYDDRPYATGVPYGRPPPWGATRAPGFAYGYQGGPSPRWGGSSWGGSPWYSGRNSWTPRTFSPDDHVVCDRRTAICYKRGRIDKSETENAFGDRAADRADDIRDRYGRSDIYVPRRNVYCDDNKDLCFKDGHADRSETREVFGKGAARKIK